MSRPTFVDTHVHLTDHRYDSDRTETLERAAEAGVTMLVNIATTLENAQAGLELVQQTTGLRLPRLFTTAGFHPHDAAAYDAATHDDGLRALFARPEVVAVGETGLDYHYDFSPRPAQMTAFRAHIQLALEADLPLVIHCRESFADLVAVISEYRGDPRLRGVFHCFSEGAAEAQRVLELGFMLGFGGVATYPKSDSVRAALREAGPTHVVLETDGPYLAPVPRRGKRNESSYVPYVAEVVAREWGCDIEEVGLATTRNAHRLYRLPEA